MTTPQPTERPVPTQSKPYVTQEQFDQRLWRLSHARLTEEAIAIEERLRINYAAALAEIERLRQAQQVPFHSPEEKPELGAMLFSIHTTGAGRFIIGPRKFSGQSESWETFVKVSLLQGYVLESDLLRLFSQSLTNKEAQE